MGNEISRPVPKEHPLAFVRRKFGVMTRSDKINRLVRLTLMDDTVKLKKFAAKANLTKDELRTYYEKVGAILSEFITDVPEIEYMIAALESESDNASQSSTPGSSVSLSSPLSPVYQDPEVQKKFEQFCLEKYGKKVNFKRNECTEAGEGESTKANGNHGSCSRRPAVTMKPTNGGDVQTTTLKTVPPSKHQESLKIPGYTNPTRQPMIDTLANCKTQKKPVSDPWAKEIPVFSSPSRQPVVHTPVQPLAKENSQTSEDDEVPDFNNPPKQHMVYSPVPRLLLPKIPDDDMMFVLGHSPLNESAKKECLNDGNIKSLSQQVINKEAVSAPVFANPTRQPVGSYSVKCEAMKKPDAMEIPVFNSPSRQPVVFSPVMCQTLDRKPPMNTEAQEVAEFANPTRQPAGSVSVKCEAIKKPVANPESMEIPVFKSPSRQPVVFSPVMRQTQMKQNLNTEGHEIPVFTSPSRQPVVFSPVLHQALEKPTVNQESQDFTVFANPTRQPVVFSPDMHHAPEKPDFRADLQEITVFANPTRQPLGSNPVKYNAIQKPVANPESMEIPVFKSPSRQPVVFSPVMRRTQQKQNSNTEGHEIPVFTSPSRQPVVFSPVLHETLEKPTVNQESQDFTVFANPTRQPVVFSPDMHHAPGKPDFKAESQVVTAFANPTRQPVGSNSVKYNAIQKPVANPESMEIPVFKSPSRQPVVFSPVMRRTQMKQNLNTEGHEIPVFTSPSRQPVVFSPVMHQTQMKRDANSETHEIPVFTSPSRQPVVNSPVLHQTLEKPTLHQELQEVTEFANPTRQPVSSGAVKYKAIRKTATNPASMDIPVFTSPSRQPVVCSPVMGQAIKEPDLNPEAQDVTEFANPTRQPVYTPENEMVPPVVSDHRVQNPNEQLESHSPIRSQSRMLGKINKGLLTRKKVMSKPKVPCKKLNASENRVPKSTAQTVEVKVCPTSSRELNGNQKSDNRKPNVTRRCIDKLHGKTEYNHAKRSNVIKVKPASPECTAQNYKKFLCQKPVRSNPEKKKVLPQTNLRPDKGIVWPTDLEGLSRLNKAYFVEQFLRTELFKQRCKRKEKGGTVWMNGLSKFQLWVIENQGTDAIAAVLDTVPKNKTDAVAKVQCWRSDSPEC